jgi:hypothetical protein
MGSVNCRDFDPEKTLVEAIKGELLFFNIGKRVMAVYKARST